MDFGIAGKKARVAGAAGGIGGAGARALAAEGVALAINDIDAAAALACAEALRQSGARAVACAGDVATPEGARQVVQAALEQLGGLHILVNNAGAGGQYLGRSVQEVPIEDWDIIVQTHLRSSFLCSKFALPALPASGFGRIVHPWSRNVTGLARAVAKEVGASGITVSAIAPGYVEAALIAGFSPARRAVVTGQNPLGRFCRPDEVGALVAFLCSVQAAYINGALICMDGGKRDFFWADT